MRRVVLLSSAALVALSALSGCGSSTQEQASEITTDSLLASSPVEPPEASLSPQSEFTEPVAEEPPVQPVRQPASKPRPRSTTPPAPTRSTPPPAREPVETGPMLEAGTAIEVSVASQVSSEHVQPGDTWVGEVKEAVIVDGQVVIPAGSTVNGVITGARSAEKGSRAFLLMEVQSITANGKNYPVQARTDSIIAGSTRARNLGAIAGGAAAGALIGKAVGGSGKGALVGGLLGGAAASGVVAGSKGYQVVIKEGTVITFAVRRSVRMTS